MKLLNLSPVIMSYRFFKHFWTGLQNAPKLWYSSERWKTSLGTRFTNSELATLFGVFDISVQEKILYKLHVDVISWNYDK